jgi:hypothetical protein
MKARTLLFSALAGGAVLSGGTVLAQDTPAPATTAATSTSGATSASFQTPQGEVVINSAPAPAPTIGPAPEFSQLSGGGKGISADQAVSYPPLANDFINADSNKNGTISESEYARWSRQLN